MTIDGTGNVGIGTTGPDAKLHANAGTSETVKIHSDQGTGVASIDILSDVGGIALTSGLASADAINLIASAGGVDVDGALQVNIASSQNAADAVRINSSAGGIDIDAAGAAGEDITLDNAAGSIVITAAEAIADSIVLSSTNGGIDISAVGAGAGLDIDIVNTGGSIILSATESANDAIKVEATAGGIDILASGAAAGEDIDVIATGSSVNITSTEAVGNAINLSASNAAGGIILDAGTGKVSVTGANLSLGTAAMQFEMTGGAATDFIGQGTLVAGTVTISNTNIAAGDRIFVTRNALNASPELGDFITTISAATSFTVASYDAAGALANTDVSGFDYFIVREL